MSAAQQAEARALVARSIVRGVLDATAAQHTPGRTQIDVPATFWHDHADRCPSDTGEAGICEELHDFGRRVRICGTAEQIECLRSDAAYYCDRWGPDECPPSIKRSARATLAAIAKATGSA